MRLQAAELRACGLRAMEGARRLFSRAGEELQYSEISVGCWSLNNTMPIAFGAAFLNNVQINPNSAHCTGVEKNQYIPIS